MDDPFIPQSTGSARQPLQLVEPVNLDGRDRRAWEGRRRRILGAREARDAYTEWIRMEALASGLDGYGIGFFTATHRRISRKGLLKKVRDPVWVAQCQRRFHRRLRRQIYGRRGPSPLGGVYAIEPHRSGDLHTHGIIWGLPSVVRYAEWFDLVDEAWRLGRTQIRPAKDDDIAYVAKYAVAGYLGHPMCAVTPIGRFASEQRSTDSDRL